MRNKLFFVLVLLSALMATVVITGCSLAEKLSQPDHDEVTGEEIDEDLRIDTGRFAGKNNGSIAVKISGVPDEIDPRIFRLSEEILDNYDQYTLKPDDVIKFTYKLDEQGEEVIIELTKMNNFDGQAKGLPDYFKIAGLVRINDLDPTIIIDLS